MYIHKIITALDVKSNSQFVYPIVKLRCMSQGGYKPSTRFAGWMRREREGEGGRGGEGEPAEEMQYTRNVLRVFHLRSRMASVPPTCSASHRGAGTTHSRPGAATLSGRANAGRGAGCNTTGDSCAVTTQARYRRGTSPVRSLSSDASGSTTGMGDCAVDQAYEMLLLDGTHIYIDCRTESEYKDGHPTSSANIPFPRSDAGEICPSSYLYRNHNI